MQSTLLFLYIYNFSDSYNNLNNIQFRKSRNSIPNLYNFLFLFYKPNRHQQPVDFTQPLSSIEKGFAPFPLESSLRSILGHTRSVISIFVLLFSEAPRKGNTSCTYLHHRTRSQPILYYHDLQKISSKNKRLPPPLRQNKTVIVLAADSLLKEKKRND